MRNHSRKRYLSALLFIFIVILFVGCSSDETEGTEENPDQREESSGEKENEAPREPWAYDGEPVTLKMLIWIDEETFRIRYKEQIEETFPDITLELISGNPTGSEFIQELFAKGEIPDISVGGPNIELVEKLDFLMPIDEYIEQTNFDLNVFQEGIIENLRAIDPLGEGHLYGLPIENSVRALFYNKDIFDLLGEQYPEDDMTWDEVLTLAQKLTVERDGVRYKGLELDPNSTPFMQLGVPGTDPEAGDVLFANDPNTKKFFDLLDRYRTIPGMINPDPENNPDSFDSGQQNIAMRVLNAPWFELLTRVEGFNFDLVTVPTWEDLPNVAPTWGALPFNVVKHSENKDAAWSVIAYLASEEGQISLSRAGSPPTIESETAFEQFTAVSTEDLNQTFNSTAPYRQTLAGLAPYSQYDEPFNSFMITKSAEFLTSEQDVITYIREMGEEYAAIVKELKGQE